jgi:hypothetical protein
VTALPFLEEQWEEVPRLSHGLPSLALDQPRHRHRLSEIRIASLANPPGQDLGTPEDCRKGVGQVMNVEGDVVDREWFHGLVLSYERQST